MGPGRTGPEWEDAHRYAPARLEPVRHTDMRYDFDLIDCPGVVSLGGTELPLAGTSVKIFCSSCESCSRGFSCSFFGAWRPPWSHIMKVNLLCIGQRKKMIKTEILFFKN